MTLAPLNSLKRKEELNREEMEARRLAAARDLLNGVSQSHVARRYGVSRTTASRWHRSIVIKGVESLHKRRATGRPSRLTADQADAIRQMYFEGALAHGFSSNRWTTAKLAVAIEQRFGIHYDQDHVGRLMHKLGLRQRRFVYAPAASAANLLSEIAATASS
ncbi:MAG: winged helix-turn-helix domain-containing protein [Bryobacteraceae bacterium]|jgi:transposase